MHSNAATVEAYIASLPPERREAIESVRAVVLKNLPKGYEETMNWGMISYQVPLSVYPDTYNKQPLMYAALASQKNHMAVYLSSIYTPSGDEDSDAESFERAYRATGKRYDVGKSCVRFREIDDLPLDLIGKTIKGTPMRTFVEQAKAMRASRPLKPK